jgi:predicted RNA-binding protein with RPS1 domain
MEIKVEGKSKKYANSLKECYCGKDSDLTSFLLFKYEYIYFNKDDKNFSLNMNKLSNDSLIHLEVFGKLISLLGEKPELVPIKNIEKFFLSDKNVLLEVNIRLIKQKIILYTEKINEINDHFIKDILENFLIEERKNLKILEILQLKNKIIKH